MPYITVTHEVLLSSSKLLTVNIPSSHQPKYSQDSTVPSDHLSRYIYCKNCGISKKFVMNCGSRTCPYCREKSIRKTLDRKGLRKHCPKDLRFMTLTVKSFPTLDFGTASKVRDMFRHLIRRKQWKSYVSGGLYVIEVTHNQAGYHYHLHVIYQGKYYPQMQLRELWNDVTGGSYIVWISRIYDCEKSFDYVTRYISKVEKGNIDRHHYDCAFKGIKLVQFFGAWVKIKGIIKSCKCEHCGNDEWSIKPNYKESMESLSDRNTSVWARINGKGKHPPNQITLTGDFILVDGEWINKLEPEQNWMEV